MRRTRTVLLTLVIGLLPAIGALLPQPVLAADVVVGQDDYACDRDGLAAAIDAADDGSTVTFNCAEPQIDITSVITITGSVTIDGSNSEGGDPIILDGGYDGSNPDSGSQIFNVDGTGDLTLHHLTLQHGYTNGYGGAIWNSGTLTIRQGSFNDNSSGFIAGAIGNSNSGTLTISQSSFTGNQADSGGAIDNLGRLIVDSSTFSGNTASYSGSAIYTAPNTGGTDCDTDGQPDFDQLSKLRPHGEPALCDIGAVEYRVGNQPPSAGGLTLDIPQPVFTGQPVSIAITASDVSDPDNPDLYYWLDCDSDDSNELDYSSGNTETCTYAAPGSYTIAGGISDSDVLLSQTTTIEVLELDLVDLCANRWTGDLRMPPSNRCVSTETTVSITLDAPATLCANRWTGDARYSRYGRCRTTESSYEVNGTNTLDVCANRWTGDLHIDSRCYSTERSDQL